MHRRRRHSQTFPAAFLAALEQHLNRPIVSYFDLIAGTSTGGIIAIGLEYEPFGLSYLLDLYEQRGPEIFGGDRPVADYLCRNLRALRWVYRRKHDPAPLRTVLHDVLGEKGSVTRKPDLSSPLNPVAQSVYIYKTAHHPRLRNDYKSFAVDIALATAAAPTYFPQHITEHGVGLLDGGIWANNPIDLAVVEAVTLLGCHGIPCTS